MISNLQSYLPASGLPDYLSKEQVYHFGPTNIVCSICLCVYDKPFTLACGQLTGHTFCEACLTDAFSKNPRCPICRSSILEMPAQLDQKFEDYIFNLQMQCLYCKQEMEIRDYKLHFKCCPCVPLRCKCEEVILRKDFLDAEKNCQCPKENCQYCTKNYYQRMVGFHRDICRTSSELKQYGTMLLNEAELTGESETILTALEQMDNGVINYTSL